MPMVIGVVTSPTGAVIRDIIHRIKDRFPLTIIVWPVRVQGETCGAEVTAAVAGFNALPVGGPVRRPDVLIVARGGGSLEDLWGFNDEALARAVAASVIPVISAVGHETDWTLIDYVADRRAPTPTGAAEMAVPVKAELEATLAGLAARLRACTTRNFDRKRTALRAAARALPSPDQLLALPRRRFDEATSRLGRALTVSTERKRARFIATRLTPATLSRRIDEARKAASRDLLRAQAALRALVRERHGKFDRARSRLSVEPVARRQKIFRDSLTVLDRRGEQAMSAWLEKNRTRLTHSERLLSTLKLSDQSILDRGYAMVIDADGKLIKRAAEVAPGAELTLKFADGTARATGGGLRLRSAKAVPKVKDPGAQGSLF
jgi:exodeoxyribonuclease VII large subunit